MILLNLYLVLGKKQRYRDWFDENDVEIQIFFNEMYIVFKVIMQVEILVNRVCYRGVQNKCQCVIWYLKIVWWIDRVLFNQYNIRKVFEGIKLFFGFQDIWFRFY